MKNKLIYSISFFLLIMQVSAYDIDMNINIVDVAPEIWISDYHVEPDDHDGYASYGFPGEQVIWEFLARSQYGDEKITEIYVTLDGNKVLNCRYHPTSGYIDFAGTDFNPDTDIYGICTLTVTDSWHGEYEVETWVKDIYGNTDSKGFNMFFNPSITLSTDNPIDISGMPGSSVFSTVSIDLDIEGGASADIFIRGTHFYDSHSSPAKCPITNQFDVTNIKYSVGGPYLTLTLVDQYLGTFNDDFDITFKLNIPSPCIGNFDTGKITINAEII